jgi:DNA-binding NarL/FixJ family response regulator
MRILIVAESALSAEAIRRALRYAPACRVLGYVDGRHPCGDPVAQSRPDVVVVDDMSTQANALARVREVRNAAPDTKIVLLAAEMEPTWLDQASAAGIDAAIAKTAHAASVGMLVREVAAGNVYHAFATVPEAATETSEAAEMLTARELEILRLVAAGLSNSRIAAQLWVAEQTVKFHLSNIYRKLGLANRTEASHYAHLHGLLRPAAQAAPAPAPVQMAA